MIMAACGAWLVCAVAQAASLGTAFTYQGQLKDGGSPANGPHEFEFSLWDDPDAGTQIGPSLTFDGIGANPPPIDVIDGLFTVELDFGAAAFTGEDRWLEIWVNGVPLYPRQPVLPAPYSIRSQSAEFSDTTDSVPNTALSGTYDNALSLTNPANAYAGSGASLTNLNAGSLSSGTVPNARLQGTYSQALLLANPGNNVHGFFIGDGQSITNLNASNIAAGNLNAARLPQSGTWSLSGDLNFTGAGLLYLDTANSRVGIGTMSPGNRLSVSGGATIDRNAQNTGTPANALRFGSDGSGEAVSSRRNPGPNQFGLDFYTDAQNRMSISNAGNVGIGTIDPQQELHVVGRMMLTGGVIQNGTSPIITTTQDMGFYSTISGRWMRFVTNNSPIRFWTNLTDGSAQSPPSGSAVMSILANGNVGIGVHSPQAPLHVTEGASGMGVILPGLRVQQNFLPPVTPSVIGGSSGNTVNVGVRGATIAGGGSSSLDFFNHVSGDYGAIGGGIKNIAGVHATVGGGGQNTASGNSSTVGGGAGNTAAGLQSTVVGGGSNQALGELSTIIGGGGNTASGSYSVAAGRFARATHDGSYVLVDASPSERFSTATNRFHCHFANGYQLFTGGGLGVQALGNATSWSSISDRNVKQNFQPIDPIDVVERLAKVPIMHWTYIADEDNTPHMGPTAQDFFAAFGLGASDRHIATLDADGVLFAAVQGLYQMVHERGAEIASLRAEMNAEIAAQQATIESLAARIDRLERLIQDINTNGEGEKR